MAVHFATGSDYLQRTSALLPTSGNRTWCAWVRQNTIPTSGDYNTAFASIDLTPATYDKWGGIYLTDSPFDSLSLQVDTNVSTSDASALAGAWRFFAWVTSGTAQRFYVNGSLIGSVTQDLSHLTSTYDLLGGDSFGIGNLDVAYCRQWTAALTLSQIEAEMMSEAAVLATGLYMDCDFESNLNDASGLGHNWTAVGTTSFVAGPTLLSNTTAATATEITSLPFSETLKVSPTGSSVNPHVWYTYTAQAGDVVIGTWAFTSLASAKKPSVDIWIGPTPTSLTRLGDTVNISFATNVPYSVPITPGTTYYFEVYDAGLDDAATADFTFSAVAQPDIPISRGDLFINDETFGFPVVAMNPGGTVKKHYVFSAGESADTQPDGTVLAEAVDYNLDPIGLQIWDADFTLQQTIPYPANFHDQVFHIVTSALGGWFVSAEGADTTHTTITKVAADGVIGQTWTVTHSATSNTIGCCVSPDETVLYYAITGTANVPLKRWDLVNNIALADLAAGVASHTVMQDLLCLTDGTVIVAYKKITAVRDSYVVQYSAAGAVLHTYMVGSSTMAINRMCRSLDNLATFWVWIYPQDVGGHIDGTNRYLQVVVADGTLETDFTVAQYEQGNYQPAATATPTARFGPSFSCPLWIYPVTGPTPVQEPVEYLIRRERIFPVQSREQRRLFFSKLQLYFEAGVGLSTGQGSDPIVELDWSDDGGHTWSNLHLIQTGKQGQYKWRAMKWNMGSARERLYRVAVTDPVQWTLIDAFLEFTEGLS